MTTALLLSIANLLATASLAAYVLHRRSHEQRTRAEVGDLRTLLLCLRSPGTATASPVPPATPADPPPTTRREGSSRPPPPHPSAPEESGVMERRVAVEGEDEATTVFVGSVGRRAV